MLNIDLETKIANAKRVDLHYKPPYETKWAVVEYSCQRGKPLKVASYYIYGEELKTGSKLLSWHWLPSTNFYVLEAGFESEDAAKQRLKELRRLKNG